MARRTDSDVRTRFETIAKDVTFQVLLPRRWKTDENQSLKVLSLDDVVNLPARQALFFDEKTTVVLILKIAAGGSNLTEILPSLEIGIAAHVTDSLPQSTDKTITPIAKHELGSSISPATQPDVLVENDEHSYAIWSYGLHISRPRARLQKPLVQFTGSISLTSAALAIARRSQHALLESYEPLPRNVLAPLQFDPALHGSGIQLSETRITKFVPGSIDPRGEIRPIRGASSRPLAIFPALSTRIRYSTLTDSIIASLHIETAQSGLDGVAIKHVGLDCPDALSEDLSQLSLPREAHSGDEIVVLQRLRGKPGTEGSERSMIAVNIEASVSAGHDKDVPLSIKWQAQVNMAQISTKPTYRWSRPVNGLSKQPSRMNLPTISASLANDTPPKGPLADSKVLFTFTAPATTRQDEELQLQVQCINHSDRTRRFALVGLQPKRLPARPADATANSETKNIMELLKSSPPDLRRSQDVLDLNPDLRIGPVDPGACYETVMKFGLMTTGVLDLGGVRIVDLDSRQTVDVRQLPDVTALQVVH